MDTNNESHVNMHKHFDISSLLYKYNVLVGS